MTELSPAARAVINSAVEVTGYGQETPLLCARIAAALRAAADQVVPASPSADHAHLAIRYGLHRIADELDHNRQCLLDDRRLTHPLADKARAALAEPEPEVPTDQEIMELMPQEMHSDLAAAARAMTEQAGTDSTRVKGLHRIILNRHAVDLARAALVRWGNHPVSTPQPVLVSERLPGPEDCNGDGEVWAWRRFDPEGDEDNGDYWCLAFHEWLEDEDCCFTHWLPAHAVPLPIND